MPFHLFDRSRITFQPLSGRRNRADIQTMLQKKASVADPELQAKIEGIADDIRDARDRGSQVVLAFGAHTVKNGLGPVIIDLLSKGWITHLATNGAGIIHDWEIAFQGKTSEDVRENIEKGQFGAWEETGSFLNCALAVGAYEGLGYGESIGKMTEEDGFTIPSIDELREAVDRGIAENSGSGAEQAAAAMDLIGLVQRCCLKPGFTRIRHRFREHGIQAAAYRCGVPFTGHPMFGCDIIYEHPASIGAAIGRTAERDFLSFAHSISLLQQGVFLSVGSAVMSPMIFEKSLSMARNVLAQENRVLDDFSINVVDLAESTWDWQNDGEPPEDDPAYYLRYCKTFSRMGGRMQYVQADNRVFLPVLAQTLSL